MTLFRNRQGGEADPFTDLLFNTLLTFTFLFLIALLLLNPPAKAGIIDPKAEFIITVSWPDGNPNDIDLWAEGPKNSKVWYKRAQHGLMHLDRDDRGIANDTQLINGETIINPINQEVLTIRGRPPGDYVVNLHYFKSEDKQEVPVTVYMAEVNPQLKVLSYSTEMIQREGDEITAIRFTITPQGHVKNINKLQKSIVRANSK
ncbi:MULTISPECIES: hypothetical protein [unclassified Neptuniibacter]|uniref:hypothetical protein n=1 Tax=unclassified Neptuniibacter TaxID=2630693 RepID=UPI000C668AFA|nr:MULTISPECIES: hypothetical protein [unclassified Neptuniibacter]MAY43349.1 hypothetical protein [Oceanospirillaceae bacterium]|tara:strand:+ start:12418 stop:13026 length:609 start_codon:yes stop_codon:yes gene_type:complete